MQRENKAEVVSQLKESFQDVQSIILADYKGLDVNTVTEVRDEFRKNNCHYRVLKNTLVKIAIKDTDVEPMSALLKGPTVVMWSHESPSTPAKLATKFAKDHDGKFILKGGFFEGAVLDAAAVKSLATMPGKEELQATLLMTFMAAPTEFVRLTNAVPTNFLYLLQARERELG